MHNHVKTVTCDVWCGEFKLIPALRSKDYVLPMPDNTFDPDGPNVITVFEQKDGSLLERTDCNPDTFEFKHGIVSYESTEPSIYGTIVYVPNVKVWWTK